MKKTLLTMLATVAMSLNMTANTNTSIGTLVNNGIINRNGYTLTTTSTSGSGTINETTGIETVKSEELKDNSCYTLDGRKANALTKGIIIKNGKKIIR